MYQQRSVDTLTEEQHGVLAELCTIRHEIHSCESSVFYNSEASKHSEYTSYLNTSYETKLSDMLEEVSLPPLDWHCDFENVTTDIDEQWEDFETDEERDEFEAEAEFEIANIIQKWNATIEDYLRAIDEEYGANYCPTGALRKC